MGIKMSAIFNRIGSVANTAKVKTVSAFRYGKVKVLAAKDHMIQAARRFFQKIREFFGRATSTLSKRKIIAFGTAALAGITAVITAIAIRLNIKKKQQEQLVHNPGSTPPPVEPEPTPVTNPESTPLPEEPEPTPVTNPEPTPPPVEPVTPEVPKDPQPEPEEKPTNDFKDNLNNLLGRSLRLPRPKLRTKTKTKRSRSLESPRSKPLVTPRKPSGPSRRPPTIKSYSSRSRSGSL